MNGFRNIPITGQDIPIPHSEPFLHLRCRNGSQTYLNLYICLYLVPLSNCIYKYDKYLIGFKEAIFMKYFIVRHI